MAKDNLYQYDSTAANNLDVGGISVAEGMLPSGVNNAIRELMSHQKDFVTGAYLAGTGNVALGDAALDDGSLSGGYNTAIGSNSLTSNTTGYNNTANGAYALGLNTTGILNVAVGDNALYFNTTGGTNTAIGRTALYSNTTASYNTAVGAGALKLNTTASQNTAVGFESLRENTTGSDNTAVGLYAGLSNTTGNYNVAFGTAALRSNTTASYNTTVGYQAGYANTTGTGNTFIGLQTGYNNTTGNYNTFIGPAGPLGASGSYVTTGSKNTIVGAYNGNQGGLDIRTSSNNIVLSDGDGNNVARWDTNGWVDLNGAGGGRIYFKDKNNSRANVWSIQPTAATFYIFDADGSNYAYLNQNFTGWSFASDQRLKENIVDLDYGLNTVLSMRPKRYTFLPTNTENIGFVAQELLPILPEAVTGTEQPFEETDSETEKAEKCLGISKETIIPVLVKAIQEQQETITALTARIEALETN